MKITADLSDVQIELKNKGITLHIADNSGKHVGDLRLGQATGEWMPGKTHAGNGYQFKIDELLGWIEDQYDD